MSWKKIFEIGRKWKKENEKVYNSLKRIHVMAGVITGLTAGILLGYL